VTLEEVRRALALPRPGRAAQVRMSPRPRPGDVFPLPPEIHPKEAGVLILLFPDGGDLGFFLTRRADTVENHKGQISLPGGAQESRETLQQTAMRETCEELRFDPARVEMLGELSPVYIPVSGFRVTPFVAFTPERPRVNAAPEEVVEIIDVPLELLVDEKIVAEEEWSIRGYAGIVPFFNIRGHKVWGATAMMLGEFVEMLRNERNVRTLEREIGN
jgi:8-oxo-dGTP pyrophosphatase MutT (NUDIX family)